MIGVTLWCLGQLLESLVTDHDLKLWAAALQYPGAVVTPVAWFAFALNYANGARRSSALTLLLMSIIPVITLCLVATNGWHGLIWKSTSLVSTSDLSFVGLVVDGGPWSVVWGVYAWALMFAATVILAFVLSQSKRLRRPFFAVMAAPMIASASIT